MNHVEYHHIELESNAYLCRHSADNALKWYAKISLYLRKSSRKFNSDSTADMCWKSVLLVVVDFWSTQPTTSRDSFVLKETNIKQKIKSKSEKENKKHKFCRYWIREKNMVWICHSNKKKTAQVYTVEQYRRKYIQKMKEVLCVSPSVHQQERNWSVVIYIRTEAWTGANCYWNGLVCHILLKRKYCNRLKHFSDFRHFQ